MQSLAFDVILDRKCIDTVFFTMHKATRADLEAEVYDSLVNHDGYDPAIRVRLETPLTRKEWDICADYGQGLEVVNTETTWKDAKRSLKEYRENDPRCYTVQCRRVSIFD